MNCPCSDPKAKHTTDECVNLQILQAKGYEIIEKYPEDYRVLLLRGRWSGTAPGSSTVYALPDQLEPSRCWAMLKEICDRYGDLTVGVGSIVTERKPFGEHFFFTSRNGRGYESYAAAVGATWLELIGGKS